MKSPEDTKPESWHRFFGASANNTAWTLAELPAAEVSHRDLLNAAHAAAWHWQHAGSELNRMRALMDVAWVGLAAGGIALIAPWAGGGADALGVLLALAAGTCWAAYILLGGRVSRMIPGGAAVATGGFARLTPGLFAAGTGVALLSSAIPYALEMCTTRYHCARSLPEAWPMRPAR
jgi:hypothetical protein